MPEASSWGKFTPARKAEFIRQVYVDGDSSAADLSKRLMDNFDLEVSRNAIIGLYGRSPDLRKSHPLTGQEKQRESRSAKSEYAKQFIEKNRQTRMAAAAERQRLSEARRKIAEARREARGLAARNEELRRRAEEFEKTGTVRVSIFELNDSVCRWPVSHDVSNMIYCGRDDMDPKRNYCWYHSKLAYAPK